MGGPRTEKSKIQGYISVNLSLDLDYNCPNIDGQCLCIIIVLGTFFSIAPRKEEPQNPLSLANNFILVKAKIRVHISETEETRS